MTASHQHFYHFGGNVFMRLGPTKVRLDEALRTEILNDLEVLRDAAREHGARALRADVMVRAGQLMHAHLTALLPENQRSAA